MRSARARIAGAALVPLLLLTTACLGDDKDKDAKADNAAQSSAPASPPAATGSAAPTGAPSTGAPQAPGKALNISELQALLVTQKDLGPGWTVKQAKSTVYGSIGMKAVPAAAKCQPLLDLLTGSTPKPAVHVGEVLESAADKGSWVDLSIARFESAEAVSKQLDAALKIAGEHECLEFEALNTKDEKTAYQFSFGDHQPKMGDASLWISVTWGDPKTMKDPSEPAISASVQLVRSGAVLVKMVGRSESTAYNAEFVPDAQVKTQVDKVVAALKG
ncbi:hypothetical protein [Yinghuangia soli]|uniref:Lipoprotein n=1 Tax=Yinghuangia soli TaxID=2908204 RepID=A0AA41Q321_9ACTN|nr:hypothetical protein [Yinghuangia soli]MCF2530628.1 hypothetical protein [Yinghuangia soli]